MAKTNKWFRNTENEHLLRDSEMFEDVEMCCDTDLECEPFVININGVLYDTVAEPCGIAEDINVIQNAVPVGTLVDGNWVVDPCPETCEDPATVNINGVEVFVEPDPCGAIIDLTVVQAGEPVGSLGEPGIWIVPECDPGCDPVNLTINGTTILDEVCGGDYDIAVTQEGIPIGVWNPGLNSWEVPPCDPGIAELEDTIGNLLSTTYIDSGATEVIVAPNGSVTITDEDTNILDVVNVRSGQAASHVIDNSEVFTTDGLTLVDEILAESSLNLPQSVIKYIESGGSAGTTTPSNTEFSVTLRPATTIPRRQILNTIGNPANATYVDAEDLISDTVPEAQDGLLTIENSVPVTISIASVPSNGSDTYAVADSTITGPDGTTFGLPATDPLDVRDLRSGIAYPYGRNMWSGQTTVYRTGDEASQYANSFFDHTNPLYPTHYAKLTTNFTTLESNNIHGNTLRFTDRAGAAPATSGNRVIQDHLTGLEWYRPGTLFTDDTWNNAIDAAEASSVESSTDWRLPCIGQLLSIVNYEAGTLLNYGGFLITVNLWSSTTNTANTLQAKVYNNTTSGVANSLKTATLTYIYCRKFI